MWLRKDTAGTAAEHVWDKDGAVVEVPDSLGQELLAIRGAGFAEVDAPKRAPKKDEKTDDSSSDGSDAAKQSEPEGEGSGQADKPAPARRGRPRKTVEE